MILIVEGNPQVIRSLSGREFPKGKLTQEAIVTIESGGPGAKMARLSVDLNEEAMLLTFLGGMNGEIYRKHLSHPDIMVASEKIKDEIQEVIQLEEKGKLTEIATVLPRLTGEDLRNFYDLYREEVKISNVAVLAGSPRSNQVEDIEIPLIKYSQSASVPLLVNLREENYRAVLAERPYGVTLSKDLLEQMSEKELGYRKEMIMAMRKVFQDQIPYVFLTGSEKGCLLYAKGEMYYGQISEGEKLKMDEDFTIIGMAAGLSRKYNPEMMLKLAISAGNNKGEEREFSEIKAGMNKVIVEKVEG